MKTYTKADIRIIELHAGESLLLTNSMNIGEGGGDEQLTRRHHHDDEEDDWEEDNKGFWTLLFQ